MANTLLSAFRRPLALHLLNRTKSLGLEAVYAQEVRHLYCKSTLGLDGFDAQRERIKNQMGNISEKFREKMSEYVTSESKNMIFTEDLKNMIHISENDQDVELVVQMMKRYNSQNKSLRFGNYTFGPVVMRMFYLLNKPDLALECFKSEELDGFFDQFMSYQILLDLLYENQKYQEILDAFQIISQKHLEGHKYPKYTVVLVLAACYKLNTQEALDYALDLWAGMRNFGHDPMRRATTFCAALALNQGKPDIALEILTSARNQSYTTVRNLKVAALAEIGRLDDVLPLLKSVQSEDQPEQAVRHTFNRDVFESVKTVILSADDPEFKLEFNRLEQIFEKQGYISDTTLSEQLCSEIRKPPNALSRDYRRPDFDSQGRRRSDFNNRRFPPRQGSGFRQQPPHRPGLADLV